MRFEGARNRIGKGLIVALLLLQRRSGERRHLLFATAGRLDHPIVDALLGGERLLPEAGLPLQRGKFTGVFLLERLTRQRQLPLLRYLMEAGLLRVQGELLLQPVGENPELLRGRESRRPDRIGVSLVIARAQRRRGSTAVGREGLFERAGRGQRVAIGLQAARVEGLRRGARERVQMTVDLAERRRKAL